MTASIVLSDETECDGRDGSRKDELVDGDAYIPMIHCKTAQHNTAQHSTAQHNIIPNRPKDLTDSLEQ